MLRYLFSPSTAATLNRRQRAQGARVWKPIDKAYAAQCLAAAERAWAAARPIRSSTTPPADRRRGDYSDTAWATTSTGRPSELYITTSKASTRTSSPSVLLQKVRTWEDNPRHAHLDDLGRHPGLASISLAIVPNGNRQGLVAAFARTSLKSPTSTTD